MPCQTGTRILLVALIRLPQPLEWLLPAALRVSALLLGLEYPLYDLHFHLRQMLAEGGRSDRDAPRPRRLVR